jgi:hypothetical protein
MKTIGICGFGFSGSGAVLDLLKECSDLKVCDKIEFSYLYKPDGIKDLEYNLVTNPTRYFSSDVAIRRFIRYSNIMANRYDRISDGKFTKLTKAYINDIVQVTWLGNTTMHIYQADKLTWFLRYRLLRGIRVRLEKYYKICQPCVPDINMYLSIMQDDNFCVITRKYIRDFLWV